MLNVLIVDDNDSKIDAIKELFASMSDCFVLNIEVAQNVNNAFRLLENEKFDLMILDIQLPVISKGPIRRDAGLSLLERLVLSGESKYFIPSHIVGLTAYDDVYSDAADKLKSAGLFSVLKFDYSSSEWKNLLISQIQFILRSKAVSGKGEHKKHIIITLHGIRTFGQWQCRLEMQARKINSEIQFYHYFYGYFSIIKFLLPPMRKLFVDRFKRKLIDLLENHKDCTVDIVAHSFGTYALGKALLSLNCKDFKINNIILCGSILEESFPWSRLISDGQVHRVINDCGISDYAVVANRLLIPFSGMAGKFGFYGFNSDKIMNRFFDGGHGIFFYKDGKPDDDFMVKYWLPTLMHGARPIPRNDNPTSGVFSGIITVLLQRAGIINGLVYLVFIVAIIYLII